MSDWTAHAACKGVDTAAVFYPGPGNPATMYGEARRLCNGCRVTASCLAACLKEEAAYRKQDVCGFRGGLTAAARMELHTQRPVKPCGTRAAYVRHLQAGEPACDACKEAERQNTARRRMKEAV